MTQMLLFDAPAGIADSALIPMADAAKSPISSEAEQVAAALHSDSGLHHMGDLARLVLLRYDLMAKRRAERAARRSKQR